MSTKYVQTNTLYLAGSGVVVGATTITLQTLTDIYGNVLTMADFGSIGYATLEPDTTNEESFIFTGITANANGTYTLTGVQTTLAKSPYTTAAGLVRAHAGGTKVVVTDTAVFWSTFANKGNDETITGNWTFNTAPASLSSTPASPSVLGNVKISQSASKSLGTATITIAAPGVVTNTGHGLIAGDSIQFSTTGALPTGLVAATTYYVIAAGLTANSFELALTVGGAAITTSGTQSGTHTLFRTTPFAVVDNDPRLNNYAVDASSTDAYAITLATAPTAYAAAQEYIFKANTVNTGTASLNVNGLGAQTIIRADGSTLLDGDIAANEVVSVMYDGTNFRLKKSFALPTDYQAFTANGTWTKPLGLTGNEMVIVQLWGSGGGGGDATSSGGAAAGGGAGGGSFIERHLRLGLLGATEAVTVGAAVASATVGNLSSFGSWATAYGGGAGFSGPNANGGGGGGGAGILANGSNAASVTVGGTGGSPVGSAVGVANGGYGGGGGGSAGQAGGLAVNGGGGGGSSDGSTGQVGGSSVWGGGGGGAGGSVAGAAGGSSLFGGAGGAGATGVGPGTAGTAPGGGGGGAARTAAGGTGTSVGGAGARGEVRVWVIKS